MGKFDKHTIAEDIRKYLLKKKLIKRGWSIIIPEGGYNYEPLDDNNFRIGWEGNFEVFRNMNDIDSYGTFNAMVADGISDKEDYALVIGYKKKEHWIYD
jgi:hypothetical protein